MKLQYSNRAQKDFKKLPADKAKAILNKIKLLEKSPCLGKKLGGKFKEFYSLRVWPYRVIYQISKWQKVILIS